MNLNGCGMTFKIMTQDELYPFMRSDPGVDLDEIRGTLYFSDMGKVALDDMMEDIRIRGAKREHERLYGTNLPSGWGIRKELYFSHTPV